MCLLQAYVTPRWGGVGWLSTREEGTFVAQTNCRKCKCHKLQSALWDCKLPCNSPKLQGINGRSCLKQDPRTGNGQEGQLLGDQETHVCNSTVKHLCGHKRPQFSVCLVGSYVSLSQTH